MAIKYHERRPDAVAKLVFTGEHAMIRRLTLTEELLDVIQQTHAGQSLVIGKHAREALVMSLSETCSCLIAMLGGKLSTPEDADNA